MPVMSIRQRIDRFFCRNTQDVLAIINDKNFLLKKITLILASLLTVITLVRAQQNLPSIVKDSIALFRS